MRSGVGEGEGDLDLVLEADGAQHGLVLGDPPLAGLEVELAAVLAGLAGDLEGQGGLLAGQPPRRRSRTIANAAG